jgi:hypothetical protein
LQLDVHGNHRHLHQLFAYVSKPSCNPVLRFCGLVLCDLSNCLIKAQLVASSVPAQVYRMAGLHPQHFEANDVWTVWPSQEKSAPFLETGSSEKCRK